MSVEIPIYKLVKRVFQSFCFPHNLIKGGDILDFYKKGNLRKGGVGGYELPYQLWIISCLQTESEIEEKTIKQFEF